MAISLRVDSFSFCMNTKSIRFLAVAIGLTLCASLRAQNAIRIGEWRAHLPYSSGITVTQDDDKVYYGSSQALLSIEKDSLDVQFFSKVEGLSDVGVSLIKYQKTENVLITIYTNSNIDLVFEDGVVNIDDILTNNTIVGSKRINNVFVDNTSTIYFSCDFGLVEFDVNSGKFGFTMFTPIPVYAFAKFEEAYWIASHDGIYLFDDFETELVSNFSAWKKQTSEVGLPDNYRAQDLVVFKNKLFVGADDDVYAREDNEFLFWDTRDGQAIKYMSAEGEHLKVGFEEKTDQFNGAVHFYTTEGKIGEHGFDCVKLPTFAIEDESGRVWYADETDGVRVSQNFKWGCNFLEFNTPYSSNVSEIAIKDNTIYVASGGVSDNYSNLKRPDGFFIFDKGDWSSYNRVNVPELEEYDPLDYFRIEPHPEPDSPIVFIGSYYAGLIKYHRVDSSYTFYDQENSALQGAVGDPLRERVAGMTFDKEGNLWMTCYLAPHPLVVMKTDGTWDNFSVNSNTRLGDVIIDERGYKWCAVISPSEGILVYDDNGTIDNPADDRQRVFTTSNSNLPTNSLTNLVLDRSGDIWVGTSMGPVVFDGGSNPFEGNNHGYRIKVEQDGVLAYLLGEEIVTTIAVDGGNQKWIGTHNGVFVQSPNGEVEIATYSVDNSPLFNNIILDIAINPVDGEAFIGTESGIISTRGEAIEGGSFHNQNAYAFPNPVRPEYDGPIAIRGLAEDAAVKITNVAGVVVYETRAQGGQAIWNGYDLDGRKALSGVYLVFSTTEDTFDKPDALVTKILVVN